MMEIVRLRPEHVESLETFFQDINSPEYTKDFNPFPFDGERARVLCNYQGKDFYCALIRGSKEIIGLGMLRGWDEGYEVPSIGLCILKKYQCMGLGRLLLNFLEIVAAMRGNGRVMLKVKKDNQQAKKLYKNNDYIFSEYNDEYLIGYKDMLPKRQG
ncbi:MAG: GCN5-related N-acetyltransferase [Deltaproteobacteria bacterium]|nr:GCN5-related N-acetyltransferase [Deltaproteobacteria bacterium]